MKIWTLAATILTATAAAQLIACGSDDKDKAKDAADKIALKEAGVDEQMPADEVRRLDRFEDGFYRLKAMRVQADFVMPGTNPQKREKDTLSLGATQDVLTARGLNDKFDVELGSLKKAVWTDAPERTDLDVTLQVSVKSPLTVRVTNGAVSFEQIRLLWVCVKNKDHCDRERFLSTGPSSASGAIEPAKYLAAKGFAGAGADLASQIQSLRTGGKNRRLWIEMTSPFEDGVKPLRLLLRYEKDGRVYEQDRSGNPGEERQPMPEPVSGMTH